MNESVGCFRYILLLEAGFESYFVRAFHFYYRQFAAEFQSKAVYISFRKEGPWPFFNEILVHNFKIKFLLIE
jgi:hypothetical protein